MQKINVTTVSAVATSATVIQAVIPEYQKSKADRRDARPTADADRRDARPTANADRRGHLSYKGSPITASEIVENACKQAGLVEDGTAAARCRATARAISSFSCRKAWGPAFPSWLFRALPSGVT